MTTTPVAHIPAPGSLTNVSGIPSQLRDIPQWMLWKYHEGRKAAVYGRCPGVCVTAHDARLWCTFAEASAQLQNPKHAGQYGLAFVLNDTGLVCLDFDNKADSDPQAVAFGAEQREKMLSHNATFAEYSISGNGSHLFYSDILPADAGNYREPRIAADVLVRGFVAMTGQLLPGGVLSIADGEGLYAGIAKGHATGVPALTDIGRTTALGRRLGATDAEVIKTLQMARYARVTFDRLCDGRDWPERSDRWCYIVSDLDKVTGDPEQILRIIKKSPAYGNAYNRERFDRRANRATSSFEYWLKLARVRNTRNIPCIILT